MIMNSSNSWHCPDVGATRAAPDLQAALNPNLICNDQCQQFNPKPELGSQKTPKASAKRDFIDFRISLLAGLWFGCGGSQGGKAAPLGDLFLALLFGLLLMTAASDLLTFTCSISYPSFCISKSKTDPGHVAKPPPYLHPLGQKLGIFRGLLLVLLSALSLQSDATALVLQHTRSYQSLNPGSFSSGFLACRKTIPHEQKKKNQF